jgi:membrane protein implicated in regulation of membrane protease activity
MGIGLGIFLLVVGAIFFFTNLDSSVLNMSAATGNTVGVILMVAGALAIILALVLNAQRTRTQHTHVVERRGAPDVVEEDVVERRVRRDDVV